MNEKKKPPVALADDIYQEQAETKQIEKSTCKYKGNRRVNAFKHYAEPVCGCGQNHSKVKDTFSARFVLAKDVEKFKSKGYALYTDPETGEGHTYAGQVMMLVSKAVDEEKRKIKREQVLTGIEKVKEDMVKIAGNSSMITGGNPFLSVRDMRKDGL